MNGSASIRGYLLQTIICLLDALRIGSDWDSLTLEPHLDSDKVDIIWHSSDQSEARVTQVKSSQRQINKSQAERWAQELETSIQASSYALILIGPCSQSVAGLGKFGKVEIPSPKPLDLNGLIEQTAHRLDIYYENKGRPKISVATREILARALVTQLEAYSTSGTLLSRNDFEYLLDTWIANALKQVTILSVEQLLSLQKRIEKLLDEIQIIKSRYLDHPDVKRWRVMVSRILGESDIILLGNYVRQYDLIAWHPPDTPAEDTVEQRGIFSRACNNTEGVLMAVLHEIGAKLDEMPEAAS